MVAIMFFLTFCILVINLFGMTSVLGGLCSDFYTLDNIDRE